LKRAISFQLQTLVKITYLVSGT